jgi:opacity protein-like surface antigen
MRLVVCVVTLVVGTMGVQSADAQNRFFADGQNGVGLRLGLGNSEDTSSFGASFTYTVNGLFDLGIGFSRASFDEDEWGENFTGTAIIPFVAAGIVRPSETSYLGIDLEGQYESLSYSGDALDVFGWDMSGHSYAFGASLYLRLESSPGLTVYPRAGLAYASVTAKIEDSFGDSLEDTNEDVLLSASVDFQINQRIVISPAFSHFDGSSSWGISLGFILPTS